MNISARRRSSRIKKQGLALVLTGLFFLLISWLIDFDPGFLLGFVILLIGLMWFSRSETWSIGAEGEEKVIKELGKLGGKYKVFNDLRFLEEKSNIDHVVVSEYGVKVFETMNLAGKVRAREDRWIRETRSKLWKRLVARIGSPSRQVKKNAAKIKDYLTEELPAAFRNKSLNVEPYVVFANPKAGLHLENPNIKVLTAEEIYKKLKSEDIKVLGDEEVSQISNALEELK